MKANLEDIKKVLQDLMGLDNELDDFDEDRDLADVGFNSILSVNLISNLEEKYDIEIDIDDFFGEKWDTLSKIEKMLDKYLED